MALSRIQRGSAWLAMDDTIILSGSSSQRRKQLRAFKRKYKTVTPDEWWPNRYYGSN
jgi:hypothetical protein